MSLDIKTISRAVLMIALGVAISYNRWPDAGALQLLIPLTFGAAAGFVLGRSRGRAPAHA